MKNLIRKYLAIPIIYKLLVAFVLGFTIGAMFWYYASSAGLSTDFLTTYIAPFGMVFVNMLKMIVVPIVFFSLVVGAASLPISKFGKVGAKVIAWYMLTSLFAALIGVFVALAVNPGGSADVDWQQMAATEKGKVEELAGKGQANFINILVTMFNNPFNSLAESNFLPMIVYAILFGLSARVVIENAGNNAVATRIEALLDIFKAINDVMFKMVDWILEYAPVGVLALSIVNFGVYGPKIVGPYVKVVGGVIAGILLMIFGVYSLLLLIFGKTNPLTFFAAIKKAMLTAFLTRSSAATLPVSLKVAEEELGVKEELASFSLPLGATINMDGVCVHLPMFAVLTANMFGFSLSTTSLFILVITTVLAAVGAGGVPGGSLMLLFIILESMGISDAQTAVVVALALGINPILDMFETMNNVSGDLMCTYIVARQENLLRNAEE